MSKLKVNELDTRSGTTITVAAGKTLAGTAIVDTTQIANDAITATQIEANAVGLPEMAGLARGKLIVGDASGDPSALTVGTADQVLTSDGTDATWSTLVTGISWQAVKTAAFTAVAGNGYPCNTTSAAYTVTLPGTASVGDQIAFVDYAATFDTNPMTLTSTLNINGAAADKMLGNEREGVVITYVDVTQGWVATNGVNSGDPALAPPAYNIEYLVIGGAGGGGAGQSIYQAGGGGGAGGYRTSIQAMTPGLSIVITATVGDGAAGLSTDQAAAVNGSASSISGTGLTTISSAGGGGGAMYNSQTGGSGGSGGGGGSTAGPGGTGNTPNTNPSQGNPGGAAAGSGGPGGPRSGGGGGGSSNNGGDAVTSTGGAAGPGTSSSITGAAVVRAAGGAGGGSVTRGTAAPGGGGAGGQVQEAGGDGTVNTGSGGGGGANQSGGSTSATKGGNGGKGVIIMKMPTASYTTTITGSPTVTTDGAYTILTFTGTGSYTG